MGWAGGWDHGKSFDRERPFSGLGHSCMLRHPCNGLGSIERKHMYGPDRAGAQHTHFSVL